VKGKRRLVAGMILSALVAGCAGQKNADKSGSGQRLFGAVFQTMDDPFFVDLNEGIKEIVEARGDRLVTLDSQWNSLKQENDVADLLLQGADAIFINPVNGEGIEGRLLQAKEKGVPCIIVDASAEDQDLALCRVASDNVEAGRLAAQALAKVRRPAQIVILHRSLSKACIDRVAGFKEVTDQHPDMRILDIQEGHGTREDAQFVMRDLIGRYRGLNAVFAINDPSALGAVSALESAGKLKGVAVVAVDGSSEAAAAILAGKLHSSSARFPKEMGRIAAQKAYDRFEGKPVEKDVRVRVELVTKENAERFLGERKEDKTNAAG